MLFVQASILGTNSDPSLWTFTFKCESCLTIIKEMAFEGNESDSSDVYPP